MGILFNPLMIPIAAFLMTVIIVAIVMWQKAREKQLEYHQEMRLREMEHQLKMKELEVDMEKLKTRQAA
ncbi:MAG: hypothetical protein LAP13_18470 [Acidobacteriia bacterium]|nr:hypothetical protein [Terriglobia bacterium]